MKKILKKLMDEYKFCCIHADADDTVKFSYGKVIGLDDYFAALSMVSPDGVYDGVQLLLIDDIVYAERSVGYDGKMAKLMKSRGYVHAAPTVEVDDILQWGLEYAMKNRKIVSVEFENSKNIDVSGFVEEIDGEMCRLSTVDEYGEAEGVSYFEKCRITNLCIDTEDEQRLLRLVDEELRSMG